MSRHRNVRGLNLDDEIDDYDAYGHSMDDDYCISPGTAAQFTFNRDEGMTVSSFMHGKIPEEENESDEDDVPDGHDRSGSFSRPQLSDTDQARLNSCLDELHNILGEAYSDAVLIRTTISNDYSVERVLNQLLEPEEAPKPQREPRQNRRTQASTISNGPAATSILNTPPKVIQPSNGMSSPGRLASDVKHLDMSDGRPRQNKQKLNSGMALMAGKSGSSESGRKSKKSRVSGNDPDDPVCLADKELLLAAELMGVDKVPESELLSTPKKELDPERVSAGAIPKSASKARQDPAKILEEYKKRQDGKELINMVVIGHVDAGKSTLMGHLLYQLGTVNKKTMHKYETESRKLGKSSFAFAWVLDETEEERSRGVTMDVAQTHFQTEHKLVTLLDAPGHKDFIPNMITGAAQADVAILVVNATRGEFETGFELGGQTREHALLARSLGVSQLAVAINKMDTVEWSPDRYNDIIKKLGQFLKQAGFKDVDVSYIPCSGLMGENLTNPAQESRLTAWYQGPYLLQQIDKFRPPERAIDKPMRFSVSDIYKGMGSGFVVAGKMESGVAQISDKIVVMPSGETGVVKGIFSDDGQTMYAFAGDHVQLTLTGVEISHVSVGNIVCDPSTPIRSSTRIRARIVVFNIAIPLTRGYPVVFHYQSLSEPAVIRRLVSILNKTTGEILKAKPKCLTKNSNAVVELELEKPVCIELYKDFKDLGRFMLRSGGSTIAAGLVEEILVSKSSRDEQ